MKASRSTAWSVVITVAVIFGLGLILGMWLNRGPTGPSFPSYPEPPRAGAYEALEAGESVVMGRLPPPEPHGGQHRGNQPQAELLHAARSANRSGNRVRYRTRRATSSQTTTWWGDARKLEVTFIGEVRVNRRTCGPRSIQ